jgi:hypothetical protein
MPKEAQVPTLVGAKVVSVHPITQAEAGASGIEISRRDAMSVMSVTLDNGVTLVALSDEEGNGPGCLTGVYGRTSFYLNKEPA